MTMFHAGRLLAISGFFIALVSASADIVGIGHDPGFGPDQRTGTLVGVGLIAIGAAFLLVSRARRKSP